MTDNQTRAAQYRCLQQDNHDKLKVAIPSRELENLIKNTMRYRNTGRYASYAERLSKEGSIEYDRFIQQVHSRYGVDSFDGYR